jgi:hypothetical protein
MLNYTDFYNIATFLNEVNRNTFSAREIAENAHIYTCDYEWSKANNQAAHSMVELFKLLIIEESETETDNADVEYWLDELSDLPGEFMIFICNNCGKREWFYFNPTELENLDKHSAREMLIQNAIPEKPQWVRETFVSGMCMCPECWTKYWNMEL